MDSNLGTRKWIMSQQFKVKLLVDARTESGAACFIWWLLQPFWDDQYSLHSVTVTWINFLSFMATFYPDKAWMGIQNHQQWYCGRGTAVWIIGQEAGIRRTILCHYSRSTAHQILLQVKLKTKSESLKAQMMLANKTRKKTDDINRLLSISFTMYK